MAIYDDGSVTLDEIGITIKSYYLPGLPRLIRYDAIVAVEPISLGFSTGRHQLVGIGPLRPRTFFHWDRRRAAKSTALSLDIGRWLRVAVTPDGPDEVFELVALRIPSAKLGALDPGCQSSG